MADKSLRLGICAGEMSGDILGAAVLRALSAQGYDLQVDGIGGEQMMAAGLNTSVSMTPVLVPMSRGILATCSAPLAGDYDVDQVHSVVMDAYASEPFIRVYDQGSFPATGDVLGSNTLALGVSVDAAVNRVIVVAALDNLVKGTAGAALQSLNLALGLEESSGLTTDGIAP